MLAVRERDLAMVREILGRELPAAARVWVFGSRAHGTDERGADLDLAIDAARPLSRAETHALANAFEDSDLPYRVDIADLAIVGESFRAVIERDRVLLDR